MLCDVIVIGSGPAGYTAGIYSVRAGLKTLILEGTEYGGQLMNTTDIENYPGFENPINGYTLMMNMRAQCINLGCELVEENAITVTFNDKIHIIGTSCHNYMTRTIIIATGATAKKLQLPDSDRLWNRGISACAVCDGALPMFRNKHLVVVGGGDTACEEALFLSRFGSMVYMLVRSDKLKASHMMKSRVLNNEKIEIKYNTEVINVYGEDILEGIEIVDNKSGYIVNMSCSGLFYGIGHTPNTSFLDNKLETDNTGYLITNNTKTSVNGVFACGDVQDKIYKQAITAAASGCMAALESERYLTN